MYIIHAEKCRMGLGMRLSTHSYTVLDLLLIFMNLEGDFDATPIEALVPHDATDAIGRYEISIPVSLINDDIQEPVEYFLLILDAHQSPPTDSIRFTRGRQCIRVKITQDQDGKLQTSYW